MRGVPPTNTALLALGMAVLATTLAVPACKRPTEAADGATLFASSCARCHGMDGAAGALADAALGPTPRNFRDHRFQAARSDEQLKQTIINGKGTAMPAFGVMFTDAQLQALVTHVRSFDFEMKKVFNVLGVVLVLAMAAIVVKFFVLSPKSRPAPTVSAPSTPEAVARGKYLVENVTGCTGCHSPVQDDKPGDPPVEGKRGAGRDFGDLEGFPGRIRAPNLTPDKETGIGNTTDGELLRAMREGIGKDGHALFPEMPYQTYAKTLNDDDALAIIAYLRTLPAVKNDPGRMQVNFPVSMFIRLAPKPLEASPPPAPLPADKLARGKWLLQACSCNDCHDSVDGHHEKLPGRTMAGGQKFPLANGKGFAIAPNITSDKATGVGAYSDDDLRRVFDEGKGKAGRFLYVMPWPYYEGLTKEDKEALIVALRDVPAVANAVPPSQIK